MIKNDVYTVWTTADEIRKDLNNGNDFFQSLPEFKREFLPSVIVGLYYHILDKEIFDLTNGEKIFISSDKANYNDTNYDTTFNGSVQMIYSEHFINAESLDLSFKNNMATLYNNVKYKSELSNLSADKVLIDFLNKNTKIEMNDENSKVLVRSLIKNGNN